MWKRVLIGVGVVLVIAVAVEGYVNGPRLAAIALLLTSHPPEKPFDSATAPPAPDYTLSSAWAAVPGRASAADTAPPGQTATAAALAPADVFFITPTSFFSTDHWNAAIDDAQTNARTDSESLRAQASVFNGCCRIYAPRYRQMTFGGFLKWSDNSAKAMALATSDVERAFEYYILHYNHGRPFVIASHGQGSRHAALLIAGMIDHSALMRRFVAAYLLGTWLPQSWFAGMSDVKPCKHADDTGCVITWSTLLEGSNSQAQRVAYAVRAGRPASMANDAFVCTNPLSWSRGRALAPASENLGGWVPGRGDQVLGIVPGLVSARCDDGALFVSEPTRLMFRILALPGGDYRNYDYQLAWMSIRKNANDRVRAFMAAQR